MTALPNRISAFGPMSSDKEVALAQELLEIQNEAELDHFLPFILPALKLAAPLLKSVAGSLLGGLGGGGESSRPRRPRNQQEYFLGNILKGLFGEVQPENEQEEQFLGNILKGLLGEQEMQGEEEQFIGGLISKLFGGKREMEMEGENYVQEQFLGGLIGKLFGGREMEMEMETNTGGPSPMRMHLAQRFVRLAHAASRRAAHQMASLGHRPTPDEARRIVLGAIIAAARRFTPRLASGFGGQGPSPSFEPQLPSGAPSGSSEQEFGGGGGRRGQGNGAMHGHATWTRRGDRLYLTF
jgi:hypothetical protein